jgi:hypothetical protein
MCVCRGRIRLRGREKKRKEKRKRLEMQQNREIRDRLCSNRVLTGQITSLKYKECDLTSKQYSVAGLID